MLTIAASLLLDEHPLAVCRHGHHLLALGARQAKLVEELDKKGEDLFFGGHVGQVAHDAELGIEGDIRGADHARLAVKSVA